MKEKLFIYIAFTNTDPKIWSFFETFIRDKLDKCVIFYFDFKSAFESIVPITQFSMSH